MFLVIPNIGSKSMGEASGLCPPQNSFVSTPEIIRYKKNTLKNFYLMKILYMSRFDTVLQ